MSELSIRVRKLQDNGSSFRATPDNLYLGGVRSARVDKLKFELPEEWAACAVTLHVQRLSGTLPDPQALDAENCVEVDRRWTMEKQGTWMLLAVGEGGYIAMTKPAQYTCYETIDTDSTTETIAPSVYEQFVELVLKSVNEAKDAAKKTAEDRAAADQILTDTKKAGTDAVAAVNTAETKALQDVKTARTGTLTDIGNARSGAVRDVTDTKTAALTALEEQRAAALQEMQASVNEAAGSAEKAAASEGNAKESETKSKASEEAAAKSEKNAAASEKKAAEREANALKYSQEAGAKAGTDSTLTVSGAPADAKKVGDELAVRYTKEEIQKLIEDSLAAYRAEEYAKIKYWISDDPTSPAELFGGTWEKIAADQALMGASTSHPAGSTAEAGLPNVTGKVNNIWYTQKPSGDGALRVPDSSRSFLPYGNDYYVQIGSFSFNASLSSNIYGKSSTVQPPAYYVNIWKRVV